MFVQVKLLACITLFDEMDNLVEQHPGFDWFLKGTTPGARFGRQTPQSSCLNKTDWQKTDEKERNGKPSSRAKLMKRDRVVHASLKIVPS